MTDQNGQTDGENPRVEEPAVKSSAKGYGFFAAALLLALLGLVLSETNGAKTAVGPGGFLYLIADTQRELTQLPVRVTRMTDEEEINIGDEIVKRRYEPGTNNPEEGAAENRDVQNYVQEVGARVARQAHRKLPYRFHYLPDIGLVNAFALPGGHVFIGKGMLSLMDSEDELASVLGHEIEHIDHYHCAERAQTEAALERLPLGELVALPIAVFEAGYSKDQELEADREGTLLAVQAGYSPNGAMRMFETLERLYGEVMHSSATPEEELNQVTQEALRGYFRSHPLPSERIEQIRRLFAEQKWEPKAERDLRIQNIFAALRAQEALRAHEYAQAAALAKLALAHAANDAGALETLALAQFALADFEGSAASLRRLLDLKDTATAVIKKIPLHARMYALALAATGNYARAAAQFQEWLGFTSQHISLRTVPGNFPVRSLESMPATGEAPAITVDQALLMADAAGLQLLAGDKTAANGLLATLKVTTAPNVDADVIGRLGYWYYRSGDYVNADAMLGRGVEGRPANAIMRAHFGWTLLEEGKLSTALQEFDSAGDDGYAHMGQAVANWLAQNPDQALKQFAQATAEDPYWLNPKWVQGNSTATVMKALEQMKIEREKRRLADLARQRKP